MNTPPSTVTATPPDALPDRYEAAKLRRAGLSDLPALTALYRKARPGETETLASMSGWLGRGGSLVLQEASGSLLCALRWREAGNGWEVDRIATDPETRGQGYGRWLMTKLEALAIRSNIPTLSLTLSAPEADLLAYYRRMGYQIVSQSGERVELEKRVGGMWQYKR